jgi:hypothetical protein
MKTDDFVYCKKDFYRQHTYNDDLLDYPEHAFEIGKKYKIFTILTNNTIVIEMDFLYIEHFMRKEDYDELNQMKGVEIFYNFDEYFCETLKEFRKFKLNQLNENIYNR